MKGRTARVMSKCGEKMYEQTDPEVIKSITEVIVRDLTEQAVQKES